MTWRAAGMAGVAALGTVLGGLAAPAGAQSCAKTELVVGIVKASGCFQQRVPTGESPVYETAQKFRMNGFDVEPGTGTTVTFSPADGKRSATVTTNGGVVALVASSSRWGTLRFRNIVFSFSPPPTGDMVLTDSALAQPLPVFLGITPIGVKQPITFNDGTASFDLTFSLGGLLGQLITKSEKQIVFGVGVAVEDGSYRIESGQFGVSDFELAELATINDAELEFSQTEIAANFDGSLKWTQQLGVIAGGSWAAGPKLTSARLGMSGLNKPLGASGIFLQKLQVDLYPAAPYGGKGTVGLSAGPSVKFLGRTVNAVEADGAVEIRAADTKAKKPAFFKATGDFRLLQLPVANAGFTYNFGQGTQFNANIGIGLPSGKNDPGQPTYVGGGLSGWTTARSFDLEGDARFKLLGLDLLGAKTVVSDYGMAGCLQVVAWVGGGIRWSDGRGEVLGGFTCDLGAYQRRLSAAQGAADGRTRLQLSDGQRVVRVTGPGDEAPQVTLTERGGDRELSSPAADDADGIVTEEDGASFSTDDGTTVFVIDGDSAEGRWSLTADPGSAIGTIETAAPLPPHEVQAQVTGTRRWRTLTWSARDIPYQTLQFSERLPDGREVLILETDDPSGTYRFRPIEGPATYGVKRRLAVDVMQRYNTPRDELVADVYRVRRQPAPAAVTALRAARHVDDLVVRWRPTAGAKRYVVTATPVGTGASYRRIVTRSGVRMATGTTDTMRVKVVAVNSQGRRGKAAVVRLDTEDIVADRRQAARELVRGTVPAGPRRLVGLAQCPEPTSCSGTLAVTVDGKAIGTRRFTLPPDMSDRIVVRTDRRIPQGALLVGTVVQEGKSSTVRRILR